MGVRVATLDEQPVISSARTHGSSFDSDQCVPAAQFLAEQRDMDLAVSQLFLLWMSLDDRRCIIQSATCREVGKQLRPLQHLRINLSAGLLVAISYSCPILQQLMSKLMSGTPAEQRNNRFAHKIPKIESWIWTSIADSRVFWTQTTDMFVAAFQSH